MNRLFLAAVLVLAGCVSRECAPPTPDELPISTTADIEVGTDAFFESYRNAVAKGAASTRAKAKSFQDWQSAMDAWRAENDAARYESQKLAVKPMDSFLMDGKREYGPYDPERFAKALEAVERGAKGGGK